MQRGEAGRRRGRRRGQRLRPVALRGELRWPHLEARAQRRGRAGKLGDEESDGAVRFLRRLEVRPRIGAQASGGRRGIDNHDRGGGGARPRGAGAEAKPREGGETTEGGGR